MAGRLPNMICSCNSNALRSLAGGSTDPEIREMANRFRKHDDNGTYAMHHKKLHSPTLDNAIFEIRPTSHDLSSCSKLSSS